MKFVEGKTLQSAATRPEPRQVVHWIRQARGLWRRTRLSGPSGHKPENIGRGTATLKSSISTLSPNADFGSR
jgi:hypothetical protein